VQVGEKIVKLLIIECGAGHRAVTMKDDRGQTIVCGGRSGRHRFDFGDGLKAGSMESVGGSRVMAFCACLLEDGRAASLLRSPLRGRLRGRQGFATGGRDDWGGAGKQGEKEAR
jgi:hypothetical protein